MSSLFQENERYQKSAREFLASSDFTKILKKYGELHFVGAYAAELMMHGDIDMYVVRDEPFSSKEIFEIFRELYFQTDFRSYFIGGDWDDPRKGNEFPKGHYVGMKRDVNNERWKFDIWFTTKAELKRLDGRKYDFSSINLQQKETILQFKKIRKEEGLRVSGVQIYDFVLGEKIIDAEDFRKRVAGKI